MRLLPDRLKVDIRERVPVAFIQVGSRIALVDAHGVVMELPARSRSQYSFPVISGVGDPEPLSTRAARMKIYLKLISELDAEGANYSKDLSEVDLSDPEDVKIIVADPAGAVLVHLGPSGFLERFQIYKAHVQQWRRQFRKLESVDLRYENQVVVNPDLRSVPPAKAAEPAAPPAARKKP
jgi:cell division protein FtsQ